MTTEPLPRREPFATLATWDYSAPAKLAPGERPWESPGMPPWIEPRRRAWAKVIDGVLVAMALVAGLAGGWSATTGLVGTPALGGGTAVVLPAGNSDWAFQPVTTSPKQRVIEVVDRVPPASWKVGKAVNWLDRYTASDMRLVARCSGKAYRCVTVRQGKVKGPSIGWAKGSTITLDIAKSKRGEYHGYYGSDRVRTWLIAHELAHTFGLKHSSGYNLMNPHTGQGGLNLTTTQKQYLTTR